MKLDASWMVATAAVLLIGGSIAGAAAYNESRADGPEASSAVEQSSGDEAASTPSSDLGVEQYRGGAHGGGHFGGAHGGGHFGGWGGHGYGRGWGGHGWGYGRGGGGRGWYGCRRHGWLCW